MEWSKEKLKVNTGWDSVGLSKASGIEVLFLFAFRVEMV